MEVRLEKVPGFSCPPPPPPLPSSAAEIEESTFLVQGETTNFTSSSFILGWL